MAKMKTYLNPEGNESPKPYWDILHESTPEAWTIKKFENGTVRVILSAMTSTKTHGIPNKDWMRFELLVHNILVDYETGESKYVNDPDASKQFRSKDLGILGYQAFLQTYANCRTEGANFIEVGNILSPDRPQVKKDAENAEVFGSW